MSPPSFFPFAEYWWLYAVFTAESWGCWRSTSASSTAGARRQRPGAAGWSAVWVSLALVFNAASLPLRAPDARRRYTPGLARSMPARRPGRPRWSS